MQHQDKQAPQLPADVDRILSTMVDAVTSLEPDDPEIRRKLAAVFGEAADRLRGVDVDAISLAMIPATGQRSWNHGRGDFAIFVSKFGRILDVEQRSDGSTVAIHMDHVPLLITALRKAVDQ